MSQEILNGISTKVLKRRRFLHKAYNQRFLYLMALPGIIWIFIFSFGPMQGWLMAFQDFNLNKGIWGSPFVGLKHFAQLFNSAEMLGILRNTVAISILGIIFGNLCPLLLALSINEVSAMPFKRTVQTIAYLPYFVSYVVVANLFLSMFGIDGVVNDILMSLKIIARPTQVWADKNSFWGMVTLVNVWKGIGWGTIIYLATIASVDTEIYEAAVIDGAGRFKRMQYITVPSILPVVIVLWILSLGSIFDAGFDASYLLGNAVTRETSEVIDTYVYRVGIGGGMYSFSTAASFFKMIIGFAMVLISNKLARTYTDYSLW